jgi:hypothetical protein
MSYAADMGAGRHKTREEAAQREREMVDRIAEQLQLRPISEAETTALSLGVAWGTERAYPLADILAELADRGRERETYAQTSNELVLTDLDQDGLRQAREELTDLSVGVTLGDEVDPHFYEVAEDFHDPHADADPADHTIPYGWIKAVADAHYSLPEGQEMPPELAQMQTRPRDFTRHTMVLAHAIDLARVIEEFLQCAQPCPGIFTERLQAVNSYLQQVENEGGGDA